MPPISTKSTSCRSNVERIGCGWKSGRSGDTTISKDEVRKVRTVAQPLLGGHRKRPVVERGVVPVVDRLRVELELFAHQVEEHRERVDGWGNAPLLDPGDRALTGPRAGGELGLRQAV